MLCARPHSDLCTNKGDFRSYRKLGKWKAAAKRAERAVAEGVRLNEIAAAHYCKCCEAWNTLPEFAATQVLSRLVRIVKPAADRFQAHKRAAALLDFDDLIFTAAKLLREHEEVRRALADRFAHVLVDEFQDTDPLQAEIFWRLCGTPPESGDTSDWTSFRIRPGALFLVGDPKQAIYRFRGADVGAYVRARERLRAQDGDSLLSISTNFRSRPSILSRVNQWFEALLSEERGQPGFTALNAFHATEAEGPAVAALDIEVAEGTEKVSASQQRDREAGAVATMCADLIGTRLVQDHRNGTHRACRPGGQSPCWPLPAPICGAMSERSRSAEFPSLRKRARGCSNARRSRISSPLPGRLPIAGIPWPSARCCAAPSSA